jgi:hypothetical protein
MRQCGKYCQQAYTRDPETSKAESREESRVGSRWCLRGSGIGGGNGLGRYRDVDGYFLHIKRGFVAHECR